MSKPTPEEAWADLKRDILAAFAPIITPLAAHPRIVIAVTVAVLTGCYGYLAYMVVTL